MNKRALYIVHLASKIKPILNLILNLNVLEQRFSINTIDYIYNEMNNDSVAIANELRKSTLVLHLPHENYNEDEVEHFS